MIFHASSPIASSHPLSGICRALLCTLALLAFSALPPAPLYAQEAIKTGPSGLKIPRYASLKADKVNVRRGPGRSHPVAWVFRRAGLPVEIINETKRWRQIRDSQGTQGWVWFSLISKRRTAQLEPWQSTPSISALYKSPDSSSKIVARLESGVILGISSCDGKWCAVNVDLISGYIQQDKLWGVYKNEKIN